uniref:Putative secreted protein n=1 Tax=Ixodes ricinus TaxID=34613 RepID=A0A090X9F5_IXORI
MYKISLILPLTLLLVFNVTSGTPEEDGCWSCLERTLNMICQKEGGTSVHTVDFANCKVNCWKPFFGTPSLQQMTPSSPATPVVVFRYKTCKYGVCEGLY